MSIIQKLPQHLINKLKAWEIVERPYSVVKELIENSIDAWANEIILEISDWWKKLIKVEDNWNWIIFDDLNLTIEHHATSKIKNEEDLYNISTYGFRWEALASISQVSKFMIQTKAIENWEWRMENNLGYELSKIWNEVYTKQIPFAKNHGSIIYVEDLFFNVPVRQKFMKSAQTEFNYILDLFLDFALVNYDKRFVLIKDGKTYMSLEAKSDLLDRIFDIYKKDWESHIKIVENWDGDLSLYGVTSDSTLTFPTPDNIKIFVNRRPVQDKIIKKSILESYDRQIAPWNYPLTVLFLEVNPTMVDVNVHPRKIEVKFLDPNSIFNFVRQSIQRVFGENKISSWNFGFVDYSKSSKQFNFSGNNNYGWFYNEKTPQPQSGFDFEFNKNIYTQVWWEKNFEVNSSWIDFKIIGQIWHSYIVLQWNEELFFVDQHAVAERIMFEKLKKEVWNTWIISEMILNPITITYSKNIDITEKLNQLNNLWFDISEFGDNKLVIYSIPKAFVDYKIDIDALVNKLLYLENIDLNIILENIFATKACKASIKAGQKLSMEEMQNLIKDWFTYIDQMFVCQHGRPSFVKVDKSEIEKLFDRF